jgi:site-specific recombinase XerC
MRFEDVQAWINGLSANGSVRREGKGLGASRVRQAHQLVGAVLKFAVKAKHLTVNAADGVELPRLPEGEQRYLTHEQSHRVAVASGFPPPRGEYLAIENVRHPFAKAVAAVGCGGVRLHDLRHTCASLAIRSGANVKVVQRLLGHKTATLTLDRYGHLFPDDLDAVADAFDSAADALRTMTGLRVVGSDEIGS